MPLKDYTEEKDKIKKFITDFYADSDEGKVFTYAEQLVNLAHREQVELVIDIDDVEEYDNELAESIILRYVQIFSEAITELLPQYKQRDITAKDSLDVYIEHRLLLRQQHGNQSNRDPRNIYPPELTQRFEIYFKHKTREKALSVRQVKADKIGKLVNVRGIVTRTTEVKPVLIVATCTYTCDQCGAESYQPISSATFLPLVMYPSVECQRNKSGGCLYLQTRGSHFMKYQEIRIQECNDHVPVGNIPCSMTVITRGEVTRLGSPGDDVLVTGIYLPMVKTGLHKDFYQKDR